MVVSLDEGVEDEQLTEDLDPFKPSALADFTSGMLGFSKAIRYAFIPMFLMLILVPLLFLPLMPAMTFCMMGFMLPFSALMLTMVFLGMGGLQKLKVKDLGDFPVTRPLLFGSKYLDPFPRSDILGVALRPAMGGIVAWLAVIFIRGGQVAFVSATEFADEKAASGALKALREERLMESHFPLILEPESRWGIPIGMMIGSVILGFSALLFLSAFGIAGFVLGLGVVVIAWIAGLIGMFLHRTWQSRLPVVTLTEAGVEIKGQEYSWGSVKSVMVGRLYLGFKVGDHRLPAAYYPDALNAELANRLHVDSSTGLVI